MPTSVMDNSVVPMEVREFKLFRTLVHQQTGIWLRDGKQVMLASRLSRRLRHHGMASFSEYFLYLQNIESVQEKDAELRELINCVTTNKTSFFRERHHFDFLTNTVVPELKMAVERGAPRSVRLWSAASSTGEEVYSIAMTLLESLGFVAAPTATHRSAGFYQPGSWKIELAASDIDTNVLATARRAVYPLDSLLSVAPQLQKKYFLRGTGPTAGKVKVKPHVTQLVEFKRINLMDDKWPLEGLFDGIFFRNALIYFNQDTQDRFLRKMVRYLKPRGYLFLGNSEHIPWLHEILEPLNQTMYRLRDGVQ